MTGWQCPLFFLQGRVLLLLLEKLGTDEIIDGKLLLSSCILSNEIGTASHQRLAQMPAEITKIIK